MRLDTHLLSFLLDIFAYLHLIWRPNQIQWPGACRSLTRMERQTLEFTAIKTFNTAGAKTPEF